MHACMHIYFIIMIGIHENVHIARVTMGGLYNGYLDMYRILISIIGMGGVAKEALLKAYYLSIMS